MTYIAISNILGCAVSNMIPTEVHALFLYDAKPRRSGHFVLQVHNFADGVTIGAAFLGCSLTMGWTVTASAVLHEIPHELADFMALLNGGMSVKQVIYSRLVVLDFALHAWWRFLVLRVSLGYLSCRVPPLPVLALVCPLT